MHRFGILLTALLGIARAPLMATPCDSLGGNTLDVYITAGSCEVGTFQFSQWNYIVNANASLLTGSANAIDADDIVVAPVLGPDGPSFTFTANWGASSGSLGTGLYAGLLYFRGTALSPGTELLALNELNVNTTVTADALLGGALAAVAEINCVGALLDVNLPPGCNLPGIGVQAQAGAAAGALTVIGTALGGLDSDLAALLNPLSLAATAQLLYPSATDTVDVFKLITVAAQSTNALGPQSSASINSFSQNFTIEAVPEPSTWALACGGLLVLASCKFRRR